METFVSPLFRSKVVQTAVLQSDGGWVVGRGVWRVGGGWGGGERWKGADKNPILLTACAPAVSAPWEGFHLT